MIHDTEYRIQKTEYSIQDIEYSTCILICCTRCFLIQYSKQGSWYCTCEYNIKFDVLKMLYISHGPSKVARDFAPTVIFYFLQFTLLTLFSLMSGVPTGFLGGGVKLTPPPSIFLLWYKYMTFGKPLGPTSLIGKKMVNLQQKNNSYFEI